MVEAKVTLVVVPRERFSCTRRSLESIFEHTKAPFELVYVDGNSPEATHEYLRAQAVEKGFELVRADRYLSPNVARNIGLERVRTEYLVFIDNDVVVSEGWLEPLLDCADATGAAVVGPLVCQNEPIHEIVHCAGGEARILVDKLGRRKLREKLYRQGQRVCDVLQKVTRTRTGIAEFHCVLVRKSIFERVGALDEALLNTREHVDFCMAVNQTGGSVYFEPSSIVTYVPGPPLEPSDVPFYMLRWSDAWELNSLVHLRQKWDFVEKGYFEVRARRRGWRRYMMLFEPSCQKLLPGWPAGSRFLARVLGKLDHLFLNPCLTWLHARRPRPVAQIVVPAQTGQPPSEPVALLRG